jgi:hypothetical protein
MKRYSAIVLGAVLATAACKDNPVANPENAPTTDAIAGAITRTSLQTLAIGLLAQDRTAVTSTFTFYTLSEIYARDAYRIDASEPRYVTETIGGFPDPSSFAGSGGWTAFYTAIRAATGLIEGLPNASTSEVSTAENNASLGFVKTIKALDYMRLIELRDSIGVSIQASDAAEVTPISCKPTVQTYIAALLDSGLTDLQAAGGSTTLPFKLPSGFTAFGRNYRAVSNVILFNRGLKGKNDFYRAISRQSPQPALLATSIAELTQALGGAAPGAVPASQLTVGPYYVFIPAGAEAAPNPISDARIGLNPLIKDSVQAGDTRASKIVSRSQLTFTIDPRVTTNITYVGAVASTANQSRPVGILRDEEIVLLRAQAEIEAGQFAAATADINSVRTTYGLAAIPTISSATEGRSRVLYEKRYSLLFEGDQRLVDLRAYGYLREPYLRKELPTDPFNSAFPIPIAERDARGGDFACK